MKRITYSLEEPRKGSPAVTKNGTSLIFRYPCSGSDCTSYKVVLHPGTYRFECSGASGHPYSTSGHGGGAGGISSGEIRLNKTEVFFLYVGQYLGKFNNIPPDASTDSMCIGGGASDIRLLGGVYSSFSSLRTRIIVGGGGGGAEWKASHGGEGGGLSGGVGYCAFSTTSTDYNINHFCLGGNQTNGGECTGQYYNYGSIPGSFGIAGYQTGNRLNGGSGGGGYYGGGSMGYAGGGGGGSSYISGHPECDAITQGSTENNITHSHQPIHYSGLYFTSTNMGSFSSEKFGYIRITSLSSLMICTHPIHRFHYPVSFITFFVIFSIN